MTRLRHPCVAQWRHAQIDDHVHSNLSVANKVSTTFATPRASMGADRGESIGIVTYN